MSEERIFFLTSLCSLFTHCWMESDKKFKENGAPTRIFWTFFSFNFHLFLFFSRLKWRIRISRLRLGWVGGAEQFHVPFTFLECSQRNEVFKSQRYVIIFQHVQHKSDREVHCDNKNECKSYPCVYNPDEEEASSLTSEELYKAKKGTEEESMQHGTFGTNVIWIWIFFTFSIFMLYFSRCFCCCRMNDWKKNFLLVLSCLLFSRMKIDKR